MPTIHPDVPIDAVLWDLDGTLVDSSADLAAAVNHALAALGLPPHGLDRVRQMVGDGAARLIERALPPSHRHLNDAALREFKAHYEAHCLVQTVPYPGVDALVRCLRVPAAVVSNKPEPFVRLIVAGLGWSEALPVTLGAREDRPKKPDPTPALSAATALGVRPTACLMVGDSPQDVEAAAAAGMRSCAVLWGFRAEAALLAAGPTYTAGSVEALCRLLGRLGALA